MFNAIFTRKNSYSYNKNALALNNPQKVDKP